jgi:hypothetical protein
MARYYVNDNAQSNGEHEVHVPTCDYYAQIKSKTYLGEHTSCAPAVREAKKYYANSNGCYYCCNPCHTG